MKYPQQSGLVTVISKASAMRAIKHLAAFGDTDIFPRLPEIEFLNHHSDEISDHLSNLQPGDLTPSSALELLAPKGFKGFRIAHQLDIFDSLIYLSATLEIAKDLENLKVPTDDGTAFSYRYIEGDGPRVFAIGGSYHDWIMKLTEFGGEIHQNDERFVIATDISDFYQRIYHHRIENALDNAVNKKSASVVKKIFKSIRSNQSFGLPVGQTASRILSESALNDTDLFLMEIGVAHTRYVDDFRIIVENEKIAHGTLCQLAEQLMLTEGLSLNSEKTKIISLQSLQADSSKRVDDVINNPTMKKFQNYLKLTYEDDPSEDEEEDDAASLIFFDGNDIIDRIIELEEVGGSDPSAFKALFKALRLSINVSVEKILEIPEFFAYLMPRDYCRSLQSMVISSEEESEILRKKFFLFLINNPYRDLLICRYWILDLFVRGIIPSTWEDFKNYDFSKTIPERRAEHFLRGRFKHTHWFRAKKTQFAGLSNWEKTSFALGATCLPKDEYEKWITSSKPHMPGPFANLLCEWLKFSWGNLEEILAPSKQ